MVSLSLKNVLVVKNNSKKSLPGSMWSIKKKNFIDKRIKANQRKEIPRHTRLSGVLTLEAAVVLPMAACFFVSILFFFRVMQVQLEMQKVLDDTGRQMAVYLAEEENIGKEAAVSELFFRKELMGRENIKKYVPGGILGVSIASSVFMENEICIKAEYDIRLPVSLLGIRNIPMFQSSCCRKWNGWKPDNEADESDNWVYVTETGTVYHTMRSCTYLTLSIESVSRSAIPQLRNENGEKYYECERCAAKENKFGKVYITNQGKRYHKDLNCSGIKRTIYMIRLSEAGERRMCSKCGMNEP